MRTPFSVHGVVPIGARVPAQRTIPLVRARTLSITVKLTFVAASDTDALVELYYSPDGNTWDTLVYTSFVIAHTASTTKQRTVVIDPPEHGYMWVMVYNASQAKTFTHVQMWYTIQSWDEVGASTMEHPYKVERKRQTREETGQLVT